MILKPDHKIIGPQWLLFDRGNKRHPGEYIQLGSPRPKPNGDPTCTCLSVGGSRGFSYFCAFWKMLRHFRGLCQNRTLHFLSRLTVTVKEVITVRGSNFSFLNLKKELKGPLCFLSSPSKSHSVQKNINLKEGRESGKLLFINCTSPGHLLILLHFFPR